MSHNVLVNGALYEIKGAEVMVDNTVYNVSKGETMIDGALYDINFAKTIPNVPSTSSSFTYTGSAQSPVWANYDESMMTIGGSTSEINAGTYNTTFTPKSGYQWTDGSTTTKSVNWSIDKATGSVVIGDGSATIAPVAISAGTTVTKSLALTVLGDGAISASSSNTSAATVSVSGSTLVVKNKYIGTSVITVNVAEGTNYTASTATVTYDATGTYYRVYFPNNYTTNPTYVHVLIDGVQYHTYRTELYVLSGTQVKAYSESKLANKYVTTTGSITLDGTSVNGSGNSARKYYYHNITSNTNFAIRTSGTLFSTAYADGWSTTIAITTRQSGTVLNPPPPQNCTVTWDNSVYSQAPYYSTDGGSTFSRFTTSKKTITGTNLIVAVQAPEPNSYMQSYMNTWISLDGGTCSTESYYGAGVNSGSGLCLWGWTVDRNVKVSLEVYTANSVQYLTLYIVSV